MYPKVFTDFAKAAETYGPVGVLPTPVFFYGLPAGEEIRSSSNAARRWSCAHKPSARPTRRVRPRLLRAERPAAHGQGARPRPRRRRVRAARRKAEEGNPPMSRPDAGRRLDARGQGRPAGQGRRRAPLHRGDEDGNRPPRDGLSPRRQPDRRSAGVVLVGNAATHPTGTAPGARSTPRMATAGGSASARSSAKKTARKMPAIAR
jgi:hypothetical protein